MDPKPNILKSSMGDSPTDRMKADSRVPRGFAPGNVLAERYVVMSKLGKGGMGVVYKCFDKLGGVEVAVKGLPPEVSRNEYEMEEIRANYQIVSNLHHQNIAGSRTLERDERTGDYYLVMDLASGIDLRRWIQGNPLVSMEAKLSILRQVAAALDYAHSEGVIHRDVKPENVMVDAESRVKVLDFGLAARICSCQSSIGDAVTSRGGSPGYKSPEQWQGRQQSAEADVYAFGVMAYWMFAGELPFDGDSLDVLCQAVLSAPVRPIEGMPAHVNVALAKALAKQPQDRFASCGEVVDALEGKENLSRKGRKERKGVEEEHPVTVMKWILAVVLFVVLTAAGHIGYTMLKAHENTEQSDPPASQPPPKPTPPPNPPAPQPSPKPVPPPTPPAPQPSPKPTPPHTPPAQQPSPKPTPPPASPVPQPPVTTVSNEPNGDKVFRFPSGVEMRLKKCKTGANTFWMGETEVSVGQWQSVMSDESFDTKAPTNDYPKTWVSLDDCREFMHRLKGLTGENVSLPDTNSWVVACLAGSTTAYWWGDDSMNDRGKNGGHFDRKAVKAVGSKDSKKTYPPNGWGLYDMHGNVAEWCDEGFLFGGGYKSKATECKASSGYETEPDFEGDDNTGFRVFVNGGNGK